MRLRFGCGSVAPSSFSRCNGVGRGRIARVNADGSLDGSFAKGNGWTDPLSGSGYPTTDPAGYGAVTTLCLQPDGKVLSGSRCTRYDGAPRPGIARLNYDGSLDSSFVPEVSTFVNWWPGFEVDRFAVLENGQILVGGTLGYKGAAPNASVLRVNADGSADPALVIDFATMMADQVVVRPNGKILVFSGSHGGSDHLSLVQLNADGAVDPEFKASGLQGAANDLALQADGKSVIVGFLSDSTHQGVARLNVDGTLDVGFGADPALQAADHVALLPNGQILVSGLFRQGSIRGFFYLTRLNSDGTAVEDLRFLPLQWGDSPKPPGRDGQAILPAGFRRPRAMDYRGDE